MMNFIRPESELCLHFFQEKKMRVQPTRCVSYEMRAFECVECGSLYVSQKQRQRNNKQYRYASNVYARNERAG